MKSLWRIQTEDLREEAEKQKQQARCSHMGCELTWNPDEQSWDCPCHGSRFNEGGMLLDNPSRKDLS